MRADWFIALWPRRCGGCAAEIAKGEPCRRLRFGGIRCAPCAKRNLNEDVPGDLEPSAPPAAPDAAPLVLPRPRSWQAEIDFKARQSGDE